MQKLNFFVQTLFERKWNIFPEGQTLGRISVMDTTHEKFFHYNGKVELNIQCSGEMFGNFY